MALLVEYAASHQRDHQHYTVVPLLAEDGCDFDLKAAVNCCLHPGFFNYTKPGSTVNSTIETQNKLAKYFTRTFREQVQVHQRSAFSVPRMQRRMRHDSLP